MDASVVMGSLVMGTVVGLIPFLVGRKLEAGSLGTIGLIACIVGNFVLGVFLSIPVCVGFVIYMVAKNK